MASRTRPYLVPGLFLFIIFHLACSGFFSVYWLKDNSWSLDPHDLSIHWLPDPDYRAIETTTASRYTTADGRTTFAIEPDADGRKQVLSHYQVTTPDGRWHGSISAKLAVNTFHTWLGAVLPVFVLSVVGLVVSLSGLRSKKPAATDLE